MKLNPATIKDIVITILLTDGHKVDGDRVDAVVRHIDTIDGMDAQLARLRMLTEIA